MRGYRTSVSHQLTKLNQSDTKLSQPNFLHPTDFKKDVSPFYSGMAPKFQDNCSTLAEKVAPFSILLRTNKAHAWRTLGAIFGNKQHLPIICVPVEEESTSPFAGQSRALNHNKVPRATRCYFIIPTSNFHQNPAKRRNFTKLFASPS